MKRKGAFITLEGNEGCGKSTQAKLLCDSLRRRGRRVFLTREPGGTRVGDEIRRVLLDRRHASMSALCETLLYMASRAELTEQVILPRLKRGDVVVCDRWLDSTVAYQGYARDLDVRWIRELGRVVTRGLKPDLSLYLDLPVAVGLRRRAQGRKPDRIESKSLVYHEKVRRGFLMIAAAEPRRFKRLAIAPAESAGIVQARIRAEVDRVLRRR